MGRIQLAAKLTNRVTRFFSCEDGLEPEVADLVRHYFRYRKPGYQFSEAFRCGAWDGFTKILRGNRVPTGAFLYLRPKLEEEFDLTVQDDRSNPRFLAWRSEFLQRVDGKYSFQRDCVEAMIAASNCGGLVINATGSGKTAVAAMYLGRLVGSACFVVDELTLLEQANIEIAAITGEEVGIVGDRVFSPKRLTVATIQTLHRHRHRMEFRKWFSQLEVVLLDEFHLAMNRRNVSIVTTIKPLAVFGLTATLELDKPHVAMPAVSLAAPKIFEYSHAQGVRDGVLSTGVVCQVVYRKDDHGLERDLEYVKSVVKNKNRNNLIESITRAGVERGHQVVVQVDRLLHLAFLAKRLQDIPHQVICGRVGRHGRVAAKEAMDDGKLPLILSNRVFGKGVNIRSVDMIVDGTGLPSGNSARQRYGRGSRLWSGKKGLLYFDIADHRNLVSNRFEVAASSRRRAYQQSGIRVIRLSGKLPPGELLKEVEQRVSVKSVE